MWCDAFTFLVLLRRFPGSLVLFSRCIQSTRAFWPVPTVTSAQWPTPKEKGLSDKNSVGLAAQRSACPSLYHGAAVFQNPNSTSKKQPRLTESDSSAPYVSLVNYNSPSPIKSCQNDTHTHTAVPLPAPSA